MKIELTFKNIGRGKFHCNVTVTNITGVCYTHGSECRLNHDMFLVEWFKAHKWDEGFVKGFVCACTGGYFNAMRSIYRQLNVLSVGEEYKVNYNL